MAKDLCEPVRHTLDIVSIKQKNKMRTLGDPKAHWLKRPVLRLSLRVASGASTALSPWWLVTGVDENDGQMMPWMIQLRCLGPLERRTTNRVGHSYGQTRCTADNGKLDTPKKLNGFG